LPIPIRTIRGSSRLRAFLLLGGAAAVLTALSVAQPPSLPIWSTVEGGGGLATGGDFSLLGSIGQHDAANSSGGGFELRGGYIGGSMAVTAVEPPEETPEVLSFRFHEPAPNPFNPVTRLAFDLPLAASVDLSIYDVRGARVRVLVHGSVPAGRHEFIWRGTDAQDHEVASGVYYVAFDSEDHHIRRKITLVR